MNIDEMGRLLAFLGVGLLVFGGVLMLVGRVPVLRHFGRLPGDIHIEGEHFSCFFPIVSMIIVSVILSLVLNLIIRLLNR